MEFTSYSFLFVLLFAVTGLYKAVAKILLNIFEPLEIFFLYFISLLFILLCLTPFKRFRSFVRDIFNKCREKCKTNDTTLLILFIFLIIGHKISTFYLVDRYQVSEIMPLAEVCGILLIVFIGLFYFKEELTGKTILALCNIILGIFLLLKPSPDLEVPSTTPKSIRPAK